MSTIVLNENIGIWYVSTKPTVTTEILLVVLHLISLDK